ncbi:hypothetical protein DPMN_188885 [Dreissena polymorpha]|uniref:Uncharacterized protein n=1 Tax=Dreissena polymorpha TaxID=45954 RepID=A0A9D4DRQ8_DREPO|nr:hypothetical protein DPMN_188885 [Dreissena polymorpha]
MTLTTNLDHNKVNIQPDKPVLKNNNETAEQLSKSVLKDLIPDLTDEMAELMLCQAENVGREPHGRRWS